MTATGRGGGGGATTQPVSNARKPNPTAAVRMERFIVAISGQPNPMYAHI
jgi:hypothetical protein